MDQGGQQLEEVAGGRMVETDGPADHGAGCAAASVSEDGVAVGEVLVGQVEHGRDRCVGLAARPVASAVRHECEFAGPQQEVFSIAGFADLEQAVSRGHDVEPHTVGHGRQGDSPRRGQLGAAVERSRHPKRVQRLPEGVRCRGDGVGHRHGSSLALVCGSSKCVDERARI